MKRFYISIKNGDNDFSNFNKFEFNLDTSRNIVEQAESTVASILDAFNIPVSGRVDFSWKVYSNNEGNRCVFVSRSENWIEAE